MNYWRTRWPVTVRDPRRGASPGRRLRFGAVLVLAAAVMAATVSVARSAPVAESTVLSTRQECQQALAYPSRNTADKFWLEQCVHALMPPVPSSPTLSPTASPRPTASPTPSPSPTAGTGFYQVVGKTFQDPVGEELMARGAEQVFWNASWLPTSIVTEFGKTGANALRILPYYLKPTPTGEPPSTLAQIEDMIRRGINAHMGVGIAIDGGADPTVYLRPEVKALLFKYQKYLVIHAKGESYEEDDEDWVNDSKTVIAAMRGAGYRAPLTIVAREGGRNLPTLLARGQEVFNSDPLHNTAFVWQAYWGTDNYYQNKYGMTLSQAMVKAAAAPVYIQVGLTYHSDPQVNPTATIPFSQLMAQAQELALSWLWWDWRMGVDNLSTTGTYGDFTALGTDVVVTNPNSIIKTSKRTKFQLAQSAP